IYSGYVRIHRSVGELCDGSREISTAFGSLVGRACCLHSAISLLRLCFGHVDVPPRDGCLRCLSRGCRHDHKTARNCRYLGRTDSNRLEADARRRSRRPVVHRNRSLVDRIGQLPCRFREFLGREFRHGAPLRVEMAGVAWKVAAGAAALGLLLSVHQIVMGIRLIPYVGWWTADLFFSVIRAMPPAARDLVFGMPGRIILWADLAIFIAALFAISRGSSSDADACADVGAPN